MTLKKRARNFFKKAMINSMRARKQQASLRVAQYLVDHNRDFRNECVYDLSQKIAKGNMTDIKSAI